MKLVRISAIGLQYLKAKGVPEANLQPIYDYISNLNDSQQKYLTKFITKNPLLTLEELEAIPVYQIPKESMEWIGQINTRYANWLYRLFLNKTIIIPEDIDKLKEVLDRYDKVKKQIPVEIRDISKYETYGDLVKMLEPYKTKKEKVEVNYQEDIKNGTKLYQQIEDANIWLVNTPKAMVALAKLAGEHWCVHDWRAATAYLKYGAYSQQVQEDEYLNFSDKDANYPYYYVEIGGKPAVLIHHQTKQIKDVNDDVLSDYSIINKIGGFLNEIWEGDYSDGDFQEVFDTKEAGDDINNKMDTDPDYVNQYIQLMDRDEDHIKDMITMSQRGYRTLGDYFKSYEILSDANKQKILPKFKGKFEDIILRSFQPKFYSHVYNAIPNDFKISMEPQILELLDKDMGQERDYDHRSNYYVYDVAPENLRDKVSKETIDKVIDGANNIVLEEPDYYKKMTKEVRNKLYPSTVVKVIHWWKNQIEDDPKIYFYNSMPNEVRTEVDKSDIVMGKVVEYVSKQSPYAFEKLRKDPGLMARLPADFEIRLWEQEIIEHPTSLSNIPDKIKTKMSPETIAKIKQHLISYYADKRFENYEYANKSVQELVTREDINNEIIRRNMATSVSNPTDVYAVFYRVPGDVQLQLISNPEFYKKLMDSLHKLIIENPKYYTDFVGGNVLPNVIIEKLLDEPDLELNAWLGYLDRIKDNKNIPRFSLLNYVPYNIKNEPKVKAILEEIERKRMESIYGKTAGNWYNVGKIKEGSLI